MLTARQIFLPTLFLGATLFAGAANTDDPVVAKAKQGTKIAVKKTKQGTNATVRAVRSAAEWTAGGPHLKPSSEDISKARKAGKVWADHEHWVYYKDGAAYGHTDTGEFWTEAAAKGAGYKLAIEPPASAPPAAASPTSAAASTKTKPSKVTSKPAPSQYR